VSGKLMHERNAISIVIIIDAITYDLLRIVHPRQFARGPAQLVLHQIESLHSGVLLLMRPLNL
jgi:hypothetical protein